MLSPNELLVSARIYHDQIVEVVGYFVCEFEHFALYETAADGKNHKSEAGIWLAGAESVGGLERCKKLTHKWVKAVGRFHSRIHAGAGHFSQFPAEISAVRMIEKVAGSKFKLEELDATKHYPPTK